VKKGYLLGQGGQRLAVVICGGEGEVGVELLGVRDRGCVGGERWDSREGGRLGKEKDEGLIPVLVLLTTTEKRQRVGLSFLRKEEVSIPRPRFK